MVEIDPLIAEYSHEKQRPRQAEALHTLKKIASLVKPLMRVRGWRVGTLSEFYPSQTNLLGLNINAGQQILLRLRYPGDHNQFLPMEQVVDTMLHELSHNVFGPHDAKFHALWDQLRQEYEGLIRKGYTGEGFLSEGKKLGGKAIPRDEVRRIARAAAEKRRVLHAGSGQKLGGAPVRVGVDMRRVIADAAERRGKILKGCGSGDNKTEREVEEISREAFNNGFRTKAEEDQANDAAIAQAIWDLAQEDEKEKYGSSYIPPSAQNPSGTSGVPLSSDRQSVAGPSLAQAVPASNTRIGFTQPNQVNGFRPGSDRPVSRLVQPASATNPFRPITTPSGPPPVSESHWACPSCTFHNQLQHLACDVCGGEKPPAVVKRPPPPRSVAAPKPKTWTCQYCTAIMEEQWWTCSTCGTLKESS